MGKRTSKRLRYSRFGNATTNNSPHVIYFFSFLQSFSLLVQIGKTSLTGWKLAVKIWKRKKRKKSSDEKKVTETDVRFITGCILNSCTLLLCVQLDGVTIWPNKSSDLNLYLRPAKRLRDQPTITQPPKPPVKQEGRLDCLTFWPTRYWNPSSVEEMNPPSHFIIISSLQSKCNSCWARGSKLGKELNALN